MKMYCFRQVQDFLKYLPDASKFRAEEQPVDPFMLIIADCLEVLRCEALELD